jgi:hypothetical protein
MLFLRDFFFNMLLAFLQSTLIFNRVISKCSGLAVACCDYHPLMGHHSSPRLDLLANGVGVSRSSWGLTASSCIRWFSWSTMRSLCLMACLLITSFIKDIPRSPWRVWLDTNHGAFVIERNIFDWNVRRTFVLEGLLQSNRRKNICTYEHFLLT